MDLLSLEKNFLPPQNKLETNKQQQKNPEATRIGEMTTNNKITEDNN